MSNRYAIVSWNSAWVTRKSKPIGSITLLEMEPKEAEARLSKLGPNEWMMSEKDHPRMPIWKKADTQQ